MTAGRVFVSYCVKDSSDVYELVRYLEARDISAWIAPRDIRPGLDYSEQIQEAIEQCSAFLVVVTEAANSSLFVRAETEMAFSSRRPIFPVRFRELAPAKGLRLFLNIHHWTNAFGPESEVNLRLLATELAAVSRAAEGPAVAPPPEKAPSGPDRHAADRSVSGLPVRAAVLTRPRAVMVAAAAIFFLSLPVVWTLATSASDTRPAVGGSASRSPAPDRIAPGNAMSGPVDGRGSDPRTARPIPAPRGDIAQSDGTRAKAQRRLGATSMASSPSRQPRRVAAVPRPSSKPPTEAPQMVCRNFTVAGGASVPACTRSRDVIMN